LSILSFFSFAHCAVLLITVCRQIVISNTAQWPKEKKDKIDTVISNTAQWANEKKTK
jgi:hypothetical protein